MDTNINDKPVPLNFPWLVTMAWRDSRRNRSRLVLFISSIILGIAALVATFSFGDNLQTDIDEQARTLVGADLVLESNRPSSGEGQKLVELIGEERSEERSFASMIYFTKNQGTRLVQVRALEGAFPYYGSLETIPEQAGLGFREKKAALVDNTLMLQFGAVPGDSIKIGEVTFVIEGVLHKAPGRTGLSTAVAPPVYIPLRYLEETGLEKKGSRISYHYYYRFTDPKTADEMVTAYGSRLDKQGLEAETVESRKKRTGRSFEDFNRFLTLTSFIALLLGCIGVASSIQIYIREKIPSIAVLCCLGVNGRQAFLIYLIQIAGIGLLGSVAGAALGIGIQYLLPAVFKDFIPVTITSSISWPSIGKGILLGLLISVLFALLPLVAIRNISPLNTLRITVDKPTGKRDWLRWLVLFIVLLFITGFTWWQIGSFSQAMVFTTAVALASGLLAGVAALLMWLVRRFFPATWNYLWRQGFANLYRPNNQTLTLITTIGLGSAFIGTLYTIQDLLISRVSMSAGNNQPNMVLFDIQTVQKDSLADLARSYHLPVIQQVPIVTMRMEEINGINAEKAREDTSIGIPPEAFEWEFRVTYRDSLTDTEKLTAGKLGRKVAGTEDTVFISMEERYARRIRVKLGDRILFNVQGALVPTVIGSYREVDWNRVQTNFRVVFPPGVLETAPQFHVLVTRVSSPEISAQFQQAVVRMAPNVSIIDLALILKVLDDVLNRIGFVIRFMAGFSILTGLIVLIASVLISKYQRIQEAVLLRTIGASRKQILAITALEYFFLGSLAASTGIILSLAGSWALAKFSFETPFSPPWLSLLVLFLAISGISVLIGIFNSRSVLNKSPLEVLRKEI
jgi:putative ABC transport system permease protein